MKVLDGRNANKVPNIIDIDDFKSLNIVGAYVAPTIICNYDNYIIT